MVGLFARLGFSTNQKLSVVLLVGNREPGFEIEFTVNIWALTQILTGKGTL